MSDSAPKLRAIDYRWMRNRMKDVNGLIFEIEEALPLGHPIRTACYRTRVQLGNAENVLRACVEEAEKEAREKAQSQEADEAGRT